MSDKKIMEAYKILLETESGAMSSGPTLQTSVSNPASADAVYVLHKGQKKFFKNEIEKREWLKQQDNSIKESISKHNLWKKQLTAKDTEGCEFPYTVYKTKDSDGTENYEYIDDIFGNKTTSLKKLQTIMSKQGK